MNYEIQIFAKDRNKTIRFQEGEGQVSTLNSLLAWEDFYYAMSAVIDEPADKFRENNTLIARLNVPTISFDEVVEIMCEDLSPSLTKVLVQEESLSVLA
ncbi:MAG: hypothetical protein HC913_16585 [Microscillaceae bacterium]|nr:hypothetical protein [Microscillaceae bacterium]